MMARYMSPAKKMNITSNVSRSDRKVAAIVTTLDSVMRLSRLRSVLNAKAR